MSGSNRNFVLAYLFLVILPLVGLAGILKAGRTIKAPISIDGLWTMRVDSAQIDSLPCGKVLAAAPKQAIAIAQSGRNFVLTFPSGPGLSASGTFDGTALVASFTWPTEASDTNCLGRHELSLLASVDRKDSRLLTGTLSVPECQSCASVGFRAERQTPVTSKEGQ